MYYVRAMQQQLPSHGVKKEEKKEANLKSKKHEIITVVNKPTKYEWAFHF
jgi:hypothetical protein